MMDFAMLPPEVNSGRMYAGAGAGPLVAAAAAWDGLASELNLAASSYQAVVSELTSGSWLGPSSAAAAAAASPYVAWVQTSATQAEQSADQARLAAAAYEAAYTATVPPTVVAANRTMLAALVATNIIGQNTAAIAANEAAYAEMWAQDATAMYGYAAASAASTQLTPFSSAPQTTNPSGAGTQAGAVSQAQGTGGLSQAVSQVPNALQTMSSPAATTDNPIYTDLLNLLTSPAVEGFINTSNLAGGYFGGFNGGMFAISGAGFVASPFISASLVQGGLIAQSLINAPAAAVPGIAGGLGGVAAASSVTPTSGAAALGGGVSAGLAESASIGGLSVPPNWATAAPAIRLASASAPLPAASAAELTGTGGMYGGAPLVGPVGSVVNAPKYGDSDTRARGNGKVIPAIAAAPGAHDDTPEPRDGSTSEAGAKLSGRAELRRLRRTIAEMSRERDVLKRSAAMIIQEATQR